MTYSQIIANRILEICKIRNYNNADLALRSGLSTSTIDNIMNNHISNPTIGTLNLIAYGLGIDVNILLDIPELKTLSFEERKSMVKRKTKDD